MTRARVTMCAVLLAASTARCTTVAQSEPVVRIAAASAEGGEWFKQSGCSTCHPVTVYGVQPLVPGGPDLSLAVESVPKRFGRSLDEFLHAPTGTMQMVLSGRIQMTASERQLALTRLKDAYRRHQQSRDSVTSR